MADLATPQEVLEAERVILSVLCQGTPEGSLREAAARILAAYRWRDSTHALIFDALRKMPTADPALIREQLPARLTRMGFPDVGWEEFFRPHAYSSDDAEQLMRRLAGTS